jgi:hypothetical protein
MITQEIEDIRAYSRKLQAYSTEELEDIYFHINVLKQPLEYRLLIHEMESRSVVFGEEPSPRRVGDLRGWLESRSFFVSHPVLRALTLSVLLFALTTLVTFSLLLPIWFFAMPLRFIGIQTAIVYFAVAPVAPIMGAGIGGKMGGRGLYGFWVLLGVVAAMLLFNKTGAPHAIIEAIVKPTGTGGFSFGGM